VLAGAEFFLGIEHFFPRNAVTEIIYRSNDLLQFRAFRIPSSFPNAHAYAGTMVMTMPLLIGAWQQRARSGWYRSLIGVALFASALGVFMAASRSHAMVFFLMALVMTAFLRRSQLAYRLGWVALVACVAWVVLSDERLQRFTTLSDTDYVASRFEVSVNGSFFDLLSAYPLGNGLGGGGTSVPYFLQDRLQNRVLMENEYARIGLEQGIPGLCLWIAFIVWVFSRPLGVWNGPWGQARALAWVGCAANFALGLTGIGLFTSVPQTCLLLANVGWIAGPTPSQRRQTSIVDRCQSKRYTRTRMAQQIAGAAR